MTYVIRRKRKKNNLFTAQKTHTRTHINIHIDTKKPLKHKICVSSQQWNEKEKRLGTYVLVYDHDVLLFYPVVALKQKAVGTIPVLATASFPNSNKTILGERQTARRNLFISENEINRFCEAPNLHWWGVGTKALSCWD